MYLCHILTKYDQPRAVLLKLVPCTAEMEEKHLAHASVNTYKQFCKDKLGAAFEFFT